MSRSGRRSELPSADEALRAVLRHARPLSVERVPLVRAGGRFLARDVRVDRDMPPADRSAVDGFAIRVADLAALPRTLRLAGEIAAGSPRKLGIPPGGCVRVLTGGNIPRNADAVVMLEDVAESGDEIRFVRPGEPGANIRRRGEEARKGDVVLRAGTRLDPAQIAFCAAVGEAQPAVRRQPSVIILCTGDEVRPAAARVGLHQLRDSNGPMIRTALERWTGLTARHELIGDDPRRLARWLRRAAAEHDVVLLTGGVSVGRYDYVPDAVAGLGATIRFHGLAIKPGKPQLYATLPGNRHVFALPGNPLSVMVGLIEFALPALRRLAGCLVEHCRPAWRLPLAERVRARGDKTLYLLARLTTVGSLTAVAPLPSRGSADLAASTQADGVIVAPAVAGELPPGAPVAFHPWRPTT